MKDPLNLPVIKERGSRLTCSYEEEKRAMSLAVGWLEANQTMNKAAICTDSLSLIQAMQNKSPCARTLRHKLHDLSTNINMLLKWVPGHKDIPGNEMADKYAKEAATIPPSNSSEGVEEKTVSYLDAARSYIKRKLKDRPIKHARTATVYKHLNRKRDSEAVKSRKDGALLTQLR